MQSVLLACWQNSGKGYWLVLLLNSNIMAILGFCTPSLQIVIYVVRVYSKWLTLSYVLHCRYTCQLCHQIFMLQMHIWAITAAIEFVWLLEYWSYSITPLPIPLWWGFLCLFKSGINLLPSKNLWFSFLKLKDNYPWVYEPSASVGKFDHHLWAMKWSEGSEFGSMPNGYSPTDCIETKCGQPFGMWLIVD